ncbi:hypothetical protein N7528_007487 [Penicillium herquei]|nr:hypothetical protein N7528_007487 [Penicillium herquei]
MALAATAAQNDVSQDTMNSVAIDIERYLIPAKDLPDLNNTEGAIGYFNLSSKYAVLQLEPGTNYTIDGPTSTKRSGTLTTRSGSHSFYAWNEHSCGAVVEAYLNNFGCLGDEVQIVTA